MRPAFVYHPGYEIDIGKHVFPTQKFRLLKDRLVAEGLIAEEEIEYPEKASVDDLLLVLEPEYIKDLRGSSHTDRTFRSELPLTPGIVEGCIRTAGGTILAARRALEKGAACHLGGGFHHGFAGHAEGFCYINDVAIAAAWVRAQGLCGRVAVIDIDVHQGNGTALIFRDEPSVFTFSIHQEHLYPIKETSDLDIGLDILAGDDTYCDALMEAMARILRNFQPELAIVVAGVDPFAEDRLGSLGLSWRGMERRDRIVIESLARARVPFVTVTGGGYALDVADTVALHALTVRITLDVCAASE